MYANIYFLYQHYSTEEEVMGCISRRHHLQEARLTFMLSCNTSNTDSGRKRTTDTWSKYLLNSARPDILKRSGKRQ